MRGATLLVSFPDQSESFVLGFEAGGIWKHLNNGGELRALLCHSKNEEVIRRMCNEFNKEMSIELTSEPEWIYITTNNNLKEIL